jgi:geranylgeranyl pyrophosphate synthase
MRQTKEYLDSKGYLKESIEIGNKYIQNAKKSLDQFSDTELKLLLCKIADSIN